MRIIDKLLYFSKDYGELTVFILTFIVGAVGALIKWYIEYILYPRNFGDNSFFIEYKKRVQNKYHIMFFSKIVFTLFWLILLSFSENVIKYSISTGLDCISLIFLY